jgi:outer membrane protein assembly factor BamE (lipoprotein component of BamABCDE complex)
MRFRLSAIILTGLLLGAGCKPVITTHGNMLSQNKVAQVKPMESTRADVQALLGPPTTVSTFDDKTWYYIGETDSREGIFDHDVAKRQMVKVTFDDQDHVTDVSLVDSTKVAEVEPSHRRTPTAGKEYTAVQQFVGNLGKFNKGKGPTKGP